MPKKTLKKNKYLFTTKKEEITLISIDPGSLITGYSIVKIKPAIKPEISSRKEVFYDRPVTLIKCDKIKVDKPYSKDKNYLTRMNEIADKLVDLIETHCFDFVLIEDSFIGNNNRTGIIIGKTIGFITSIFRKYNIVLKNAVSARSFVTSVKKYPKPQHKKYIKRLIELFFNIKCTLDESDSLINAISVSKSINFDLC